MNQKEALAEACKIVGSAAKLAGILGIKPQAISQWDKVPPGRVIATERATGGKITRSQLRPDIYPDEEAVA